METFITLRALSASPLMVGGDLPTMDEFSLRLITNAEMIACNQNGVMGRLVYDPGSGGNLAGGTTGHIRQRLAGDIQSQ